jgi:peptidoglycan/LPS O-acetylase OafA/YrhL
MPGHVVAGIAFAMFAIFLSVYPLKIFVNFVTVYLGKVSYSTYLLQFAVLQLFGSLGVSNALSNSNIGSGIHFLLLVLVTALIASVSFRIIEKPGIRLGEWVIRKINRV